MTFITIYHFDAFGIYSHASQHQVIAGTGLPPRATKEQPEERQGYASVYNGSQWESVEDDRGTVFYNKQNGAKYRTTKLKEQVDTELFTAIAPPEYNPAEQNVSFDGDSWAITYIDNPVTAWNKATQETHNFAHESLVTDEYTLITPPDSYHSWVGDAWVLTETGIEAKYTDEELLWARGELSAESSNKFLHDIGHSSAQGEADQVNTYLRELIDYQAQLKAETQTVSKARPVRPIKPY